MLIVACVLRSGGIYDATWVARLKAGVDRHLAEPHRFVCLSDVDVPCGRIPLQHDWPGWWAKIELFRLPGPVLFFDLDMLPVGDLASLADVARFGGFTILRDFYRPRGLQSSLMAWSGDMSRLYRAFMSQPHTWMEMLRGGDQSFVEAKTLAAGEDVARWQDLLPGQVVSYKADRCETGPPAGARVLCLHGRPKFADMPPEGWARQAWECAA